MMLKKMKKINLMPTIRCMWCGNIVPVPQQRPRKCPYCGMSL